MLALLDVESQHLPPIAVIDVREHARKAPQQ
jgi:hypothetical protein